MTGHDQYPNAGPSVEVTNPGPNSAIYNYFLTAGAPTPEEIVQAVNVIGGAHREIENTQDAYSICEDLARDVPDATTVLAAMIGTRHEAVPKRWKNDPDDMRMVISMVGHLETGQLLAQQEAARRGGGFPGVPERVAEIKRLLEDLKS